MVGTLLDIWRDRLGLMTGVSEEYGDITRFSMGPNQLWFLNHPEHAKYVLADNSANYHKGIGLIHAKKVLGDGLLTSEGSLWRQQRKTINPVFSRDRLAGFSDVVADAATELADRWEARIASRATGPMDVVQEMTGLTMAVLGRTLLDTDLDEYTGLGHAFDVVQDQAMFEMVSLNMVPHAAPLPRNFRFRAARKELDRIVDELVAKRVAAGVTGDDMLSRLLRAYADEPDAKLARRRIHDELVTILLAGHETTASTLSWTWYQLSQNPDVAARMRAEAQEVLEGGARKPAYEDLHRLPYTTQVIQEAMRLHPPIWILPRRAVAEDEIDGYRIKPGSDVLIVPYTLHRHPDFWPDPERFDPDRFATDQAVARHRYAYIPFGAGPRFCVGNNLGMMEAVFTAAVMASRFSLRLAPGYEVVGEPMLSLRVRGGLPMTVSRA